MSEGKTTKAKQSHQNPGMAGIYFFALCFVVIEQTAVKVRDPLIRANHRETFVGQVHVNTESHICTFITPLN